MGALKQHYLAFVSSALQAFVSVFKMLSVLYMAVNTGPVVMGSVTLQAVLCSSALCFLPYVVVESTGIMKVELNILTDFLISYP
jgi:hypothetical protein